ncbi:hypothetical protein ACIHEJ_37800 [Streptomyces sp. NPDC052301]|uniref:hypothetical protein n=1 Tax=Streptomyces sp. NPDC052301 TaxID=3365687 RepID=UPI0037CFA44C
MKRLPLVVLVLLIAGAGCSSGASKASESSASPSPTKRYLHPTHDLYRVTSDCEVGGEPQISFWLKNHADHATAYDIRYDFLDRHGKVVGHVEGVFSVSPHQVLGDEALYSDGGRCGQSFRLAYVNAYDNTSDGADQPHF